LVFVQRHVEEVRLRAQFTHVLAPQPQAALPRILLTGLVAFALATRRAASRRLRLRA
jgi:hypothetical protein